MFFYDVPDDECFQVHAVSSDAKPPPPTCERLSPIGANSRATSKLSLDNILDAADQTTVF